MATLNITLNGVSADYPVELGGDLTDKDIKRIALEVLRAGEVPGIQGKNLGDATFENFVVDRFEAPNGGRRFYLRPKVPFGG